MKRRILFVDDEKNILDGLRRMLWQMRAEWGMVFVHSGALALEALAASPFDVVVTDMRMPEMDGAELLAIVKREYPDAVRIVLSGYAEKKTTMKAFRMAHQYLVKPSDADTFKRVIGRACALRDLLADENLKRLLSRVESLPSVPMLYARIMELLDQPDTSAKEIGKVISEDLGMTAKILQMVNSAFFGLPRRFTDITQAVVYLGSDTIKSLALFGGLFSSFNPKNLPRFDAEALFFHSQRVSGIARQITSLERLGKKTAEDAFLAGLLHDVGKLVIADNFPEVYRNVEIGVRLNDPSVLKLEMDALGATHAEIGAYLMGLWGLSDPIVEAIAFHHHPSRCPAIHLEPLGAVHTANALVNQFDGEGAGEGDAAPFDMAYLESLELSGRVSVWRESAMALGEE
jgi:HD-like signal output (HDOD) protein